MSTVNECPICMECIESNKNCVTTECGHCFHTSCLMKSVAHNGFGCPYCRCSMAEKPENDYDDDQYDSEDEDEDEDVEVEQDMFDDDALRGFRLFFNNIENIANEEQDLNDEREYLREERRYNHALYNAPKVEDISTKLHENGVSYEQLLRILLARDHDEFGSNELTERFDEEIFQKISQIIDEHYENEMKKNDEQEQLPEIEVVSVVC